MMISLLLNPRFNVLPLLMAFALVSFAQEKRGVEDNFFELTNVWNIELRFSPEEWTAFSPDQMPRFASHGQHKYSRADIFVNGEYVSNVGVRLKGGGTAAGISSGRIPLRVDFDREKFHGVKKISFNSNYYDASCMREALSYDLFRRFDVPASRCAYANVHATVAGGFANRYLGLYTLVEAVDKTFLKAHFHESDGLLLKPNFGQHGFPKGKTWAECVRQLQPRSPVTEKQKGRMLAFMKLVNDSDDDSFKSEIESYVEIDEYLRFVVVNTALANLDSYLGMGKNYYIYLDPRTEKFNWIPWDLDLSFGGYFLCGTPDERMNLSIDKPSSVNDPLLRRLLGIPSIRERYHEKMRLFVTAVFDPVKINRDVNALQKMLKGATKEKLPPGFKSSIDLEIKAFMERRVPSIQGQLEGKSKGDEPSFWNGFGRP